MRRLPLVPTILVGAAVAIMIGLGAWQLQRAQWKTRLLAEYSAAAMLPPLDLDPLLEGRGDKALSLPLAYRRVLVTCHADHQAAQLRGGRSRDGGGGYAYFIPCRPGAAGLAGRLWVNVGWSPMPHEDLRLSANRTTAGSLGSTDGDRLVLTSATASPPLVPSAVPGPETISNNHLLYAFQWFFFAAAAAIIYLLALRRRYREDLPTGASFPRSPSQ